MDTRFDVTNSYKEYIDSITSQGVSLDIYDPQLIKIAKIKAQLTLQIEFTCNDDSEDKERFDEIFFSATYFEILNAESISGKFAILDSNQLFQLYNINIDNSTTERLAVTLPNSSDDLLVILSTINDLINYLERKNIKLSFDLFDISIKLRDAYEALDPRCSCAYTLNALTSMASLYKETTHHDHILLSYCLSALNNINLITDLSQNTSNDIIKKIVAIIDAAFSTNYFNKVTKKNVELFLRRVNLIKKIKLFEPCLGQIALDGTPYGWGNHAEWLFLRDAKCILTNSREMIIDVAKNKNNSYNTYYKHSGDNLKNQLTYLAPLIGLAFQEKSNFHQTIYFTDDCLKQLANMQLHLDVDGIKKIIKSRNGYRFFEEATKSGDFNKTLPEEITKLIYSFAYGPLLSNDELDSAPSMR